MPASGGTTKRARKPVPPSWEEWSGMYWRERQRVRRELAEHGLTPPDPPPTFQLVLDRRQLRQLDAAARRRSLTRDRYATRVLADHLARLEGRKRALKQAQKENIT